MQANGTYRPGGDAKLLWNTNIRRDLDLSKEQEAKMIAEFRKLGVVARDADITLTKSPEIDPDEIFKSYNDSSGALVNKLLTEKQRSRFKQIVYQSSGLESFSQQEVRKLLRLSEQQDKDIKKLVDAQAEDLVKGNGNTDQQGIELDSKYLASALELLSDKQRGIWRSLVGKTIALKK